jgi:hypothetical protein
VRGGRVSAALLVAVGLSLAAGAGCSSSREPGASSQTPPTSDAGPDQESVLETGKGDLVLEPNTYRSPEGFSPAVRFTVAVTGWRSTHRGPDGFDVSLPDPTRDAPLVAVVLVIPPETDAPSAFRAVLHNARTAGSTVRRLSMDLAGSEAGVVDVFDGAGPLVSSAQHGISLDAGAGQRSRVAVLEMEGRPVVLTIYVPNGTRWHDALESAMPILTSLRPA